MNHTVAVVVKRRGPESKWLDVRVYRHGEKLNVPDDIPSVRRAYEDNFIFTSYFPALNAALEEVEHNGMAGACAWQSGIGDWLVNAWR